MKENKRPGQQLKGLSVQDLLGVSGEESAMEIDIRLIHPFKDHPFKGLMMIRCRISLRVFRQMVFFLRFSFVKPGMDSMK